MVYYFRVVNRVFFFKKPDHIEPKRPTSNAFLAMFALGIVILAVGFYPDLITGYLHEASKALLDKGKYIQDVLSAGLLTR
jgi:formate hydrogenlyase subunit 3/multisubunit Na+/H+ antiporter MnhD subunit